MKQSRMVNKANTKATEDVAVDLIDQNGQLLGLNELAVSKKDQRLIKFLNTNVRVLL